MAGRPRKVQQMVIDPSIAEAVARALRDQVHTHNYHTRAITRNQGESSGAAQNEAFSPSSPWVQHEDFAPPAEQFVEQRSWRRELNGTTEVVNTVQSIVHIEARSCEVCGQSKDPDFFLLCDNYACNRGGHYACYHLSHIPEGKWFCKHCRAKGKCMVCRKLTSDKPLTSCEHCELFGHVACVAPGENLAIVSQNGWRCKNCVCQRCFAADATRGDLIQCVDCKLFHHFRCFEGGEILEQEGKWRSCPSCNCQHCFAVDATKGDLIQCAQCSNYHHLRCFEGGEILETKGKWRSCPSCECQHCFAVDATNGDLIQCVQCSYFYHVLCFESGEILEAEGKWRFCPSCDNESETADDIVKDDLEMKLTEGSVLDTAQMASSSQLPPTLSYQGPDSPFNLLRTRDRAVRSFKKLQAEKPLSMFALEEYMRTGVPFMPSGWENLKKLAKVLCPQFSDEQLKCQRPPLNANRTLDSLVPLKVKTTIIEVKVVSTKGTSIIVRGPFHFRALAEAVAELVACPANAAVPLQQISEEGCTAIRSPLRLRQAHEAFCKAKKVGPGDVVVPLSFYSDGTATSFSHLHPITASLFTAAKGPRVLNLTTSHAIVGMVPTPGTLEYFEASGKRLTSNQAKQLISGPAPKRAIFRACVQVLMQELKVLEEGVPFYDGSSRQLCRLFAFFYNWVADMEERRDLLNLVLGKHWVCSHCFGRPVNSRSSRIPEVEKLIAANAPRSDTNVKTMLRLLKDGDVLVGKESYRFEDRTGFERNSKPALSSAHNFIFEGAALGCFVDRLHMLDGILNRIWRLLVVLYGQSLTQATVRLGNIHYGVTSEFRFHKMEEALADFRFLVLAFLNDVQRIEKGEQAILKLKPKAAKKQKAKAALDEPERSDTGEALSEIESWESASEEEAEDGMMEEEADEAMMEEEPMTEDGATTNSEDKVTSVSGPQILSHLRMVAAFQLVVACLKDDAPDAVQSILESAIKAFGEENARLEKDTGQVSLKKVEETAKVHELLCHVAQQVRENGSLSLSSSEELEWLHPKYKKWMHCGSKRRADQAKTVLKQWYYETVQKDKGLPIIPFNSGTRFAPIVPVIRFRDNSEAKPKTDALRKSRPKPVEPDALRCIALGGLHALSHQGYTFPTSDEEVMEYLEAFMAANEEVIGTPFWAGTSLTGELICQNRMAPLKSETAFHVLSESTDKRQHLLVAYGTAKIESGEKQPCCRFHNPAMEFECSLVRLLEPDTRYSFPLGFVQPQKEKADRYMLGLAVTQLKGRNMDAVVENVVAMCQIEKDPSKMFILVPASRLRTNCFVLNVDEHLFVMKYSNRIVGHLT